MFCVAHAPARRILPKRRWWKPLGVPLYFCTLNAAALGVVELLRGKKYVVWQPYATQDDR